MNNFPIFTNPTLVAIIFIVIIALTVGLTMGIVHAQYHVLSRTEWVCTKATIIENNPSNVLCYQINKR